MRAPTSSPAQSLRVSTQPFWLVPQPIATELTSNLSPLGGTSLKLINCVFLRFESESNMKIASEVEMNKISIWGYLTRMKRHRLKGY
jgi:hypothetical protein